MKEPRLSDDERSKAHEALHWALRAIRELRRDVGPSFRISSSTLETIHTFESVANELMPELSGQAKDPLRQLENLSRKYAQINEMAEKSFRQAFNEDTRYEQGKCFLGCLVSGIPIVPQEEYALAQRLFEMVKGEVRSILIR